MVTEKNTQSEGKSPEALQQEKMRAKLLLQLGNLFEMIKTGIQDPAKIKNSYDHILTAPEFKEYFTPEMIRAFHDQIDQAVKNTDKDKFIAEAEAALQPIIKFRQDNPELFEELQVKMFNEPKGFIPLNKRFSYSLDNDAVYIHLAPSFTVKEQLPALFLDAMQKLAAFIQEKEHEDIKEVVGTSWLMATKTYGDAFAKLGFEITDVSEEIKKKHFPGETRPIKRAAMDREKFIKTFAKDKE